MKKLIFLFATLVFISCNSDTKRGNADTSQFIPFSVEGQFSLEAPKFMKNSVGLNPDASIQLENRQQEIYLAVIEEPKGEVIENFKSTGVYNEDLSPVTNYFNVQTNLFTNDLQLLEKGEPQSFKINGMPAMNIEIVAQPAQVNVGIYYLFTFIEGEDTLYMLMQWTIDSQKEMLQDTFLTIADTFEEE